MRTFKTVQPVARRGNLMPAVAIALFVCGACLALVLNQYWLSDAQEELRTAAESAALAGALRLASDDRLKEDYDSEQVADHVREAVQRQAGLNQVSGPVQARVDVHLGKVHIDPLTGYREQEETDQDPTNVLVVAHRDSRRGNPVGMIAPAFTGRPAADVRLTAEASICNLISGLRPVGAGRIPAWPIAILEFSSDDKVPTWRSQIEQKGGADDYCWDADRRTVTLESDGIREITLTLSAGGNACLIDVGPGFSEDSLERQFRQGWSSEDLADLGGEFSLQQGDNKFPAETDLGDFDPDVLERQIGVARITLLYSGLETDKRGTTATVSRMVGTRLMAVHKIEGQVQLVVQPAVIATRTAVIDEDALYSGETNGNPYIYKISLTQ